MGEIEKLREALKRQTDNMTFILNHASLPDQWAERFMAELEADRAHLPTPPGCPE